LYECRKGGREKDALLDDICTNVEGQEGRGMILEDICRNSVREEGKRACSFNEPFTGTVLEKFDRPGYHDIIIL
jgi:hypothetical protein